MEITKESLLGAKDSEARDAILFDMMEHISGKIDEFKTIEDRVEKCEGNITIIKGISIAIAAITAIFSGITGWFRFGG